MVVIQRPDRHYFTGKPCKCGHIVLRLISSRACVECSKLRNDAEYHREYYAKNAEKIKSRARDRWRTNPDIRKRDRAYRDKRRDKIRAYDRFRAKRDRAKKKVIIDRWIKNNLERNKALRVAISARRRARVLLVGGSFSVDDVNKAISAQKNKCWWCSKTLKKFHIDHRFPIAKGGSNKPNNIVISCAPCNFAKNAKMPWEFAGRLL